MKLETMETMQKRLAGCGSANQVEAVLKSIELIRRASGALDAGNRAVCLYHLAAALAPRPDLAASDLIDLGEKLSEAGA